MQDCDTSVPLESLHKGPIMQSFDVSYISLNKLLNKQSVELPMIWDAMTFMWHLCNEYIDGLVQDCSNSIANALELLQSCTKPSTCTGVGL